MKRWALCVRIALAVVAVANLVGLAGNIAAAAVYARATKLCETASLNFADNGTIDGSSNCVLANHEVQLANFTVSVQALCEAWAGRYLLEVYPSGAYEKGTANQSGISIDFVVSLSPQTPASACGWTCI